MVIIFLLAVIDKQKVLIQEKVEEAATINNIYTYLYGSLRFVVFALLGGVLALEYHIIERKKTGRWTFDLLRLLIVALPCFIVGITATIFPLSQAFVLGIINNFFSRFSDYSTLLILVQAVFGYSLVTSFRKIEFTEHVNEIGQVSCIETPEATERSEPIEPKDPAE